MAEHRKLLVAALKNPTPLVQRAGLVSVDLLYKMGKDTRDLLRVVNQVYDNSSSSLMRCQAIMSLANLDGDTAERFALSPSNNSVEKLAAFIGILRGKFEMISKPQILLSAFDQHIFPLLRKMPDSDAKGLLFLFICHVWVNIEAQLPQLLRNFLHKNHRECRSMLVEFLNSSHPGLQRCALLAFPYYPEVLPQINERLQQLRHAEKTARGQAMLLGIHLALCAVQRHPFLEKLHAEVKRKATQDRRQGSEFLIAAIISYYYIIHAGNACPITSTGKWSKAQKRHYLLRRFQQHLQRLPLRKRYTDYLLRIPRSGQIARKISLLAKGFQPILPNADTWPTSAPVTPARLWHWLKRLATI